MQALIAYSIVAAAVIYAAWLFMPRTLRRWLIDRLIGVAPSSQRARLARLQADTASAGCSTCKGCAADEASATPAKTIQLHRR